MALRYEDPSVSGPAVGDSLPSIVRRYVDVDTLDGGFVAARVANRDDPSNRLPQTEAMWAVYAESAWALFSALKE